MEIVNRIIKQELAEWRKFELLQTKEFKNFSPQAEQKLINSMIANNFIMSFHVWENEGKVYCIDGHQRIQKIFPKLETMGYKLPERFPTNFIDCANMQEAAQLVFVFNSEYAKIEEEEAAKFIMQFNLDLSEINKTTVLPKLDLSEALTKLKHSNLADEQLDDVPEIPSEPVSKLGDLFLLDNRHRVMCGDSTNKENVGMLMGGGMADLLLIDPPYNINFKSQRRNESYSSYDDNKTEDKYFWLIQTVFNIGKGNSQKQIITPGKKNLKLWFKISPITEICIWIAKNKMSGGAVSNLSLYEPIIFIGEFDRSSRVNDLFEYNTKFQTDADDHPCPKIIGLFEDIIRNYSANSVIDLFLGSGTTLIACEQTNRICYGMEIDPIYIDVILKRYHKLYLDKEIKCLNREFDFGKLFI